MSVVHRDLDGNVTTRPYTPQERAQRNAASAAIEAERQNQRQDARDLNKAPAVVRDVMQALILAGVITAQQARDAYSRAVEARQ